VLRFEPAKAGKTKSFSVYFYADPIARVEAIKSGIPATFVDQLAAEMGKSKEWLLWTLSLSTATFNRKKSESKPLSKEESERVLGIARLVGQVEAMVEESGDPTGFNAAQWVAGWLEEPLAALGGRKPGDLMDTAEGQSIVSNVLARAQSGAYA
jgi:putative toxin-antitoxin system antitoxin component (TIGR02293 family)